MTAVHLATTLKIQDSPTIHIDRPDQLKNVSDWVPSDVCIWLQRINLEDLQGNREIHYPSKAIVIANEIQAHSKIVK